MRKAFPVPLGERVLALFFPARCLCCGRALPSNGLLCKDCGPLEEAPPFRQFPLDGAGKTLTAAAPLYYRGGFRETLHRYKFRGERGLAGQLGRLMAGRALDFPAGFDGVSFAPLSKERLRERGYDQSGLLAKSLAKALGLPLLPLLEKTRDTRRQHELGRTQRRENAKEGGYRAKPQAAGKSLLLVDDIVTTGATLCQCAQALYAAGAREVYGLCAASAQKKEGKPHGEV